MAEEEPAIMSSNQGQRAATQTMPGISMLGACGTAPHMSRSGAPLASAARAASG